MFRTRIAGPVRAIPADAIVELLKPVTWFAPMWAFACGAISAATIGQGVPIGRVIAGMALAGPLVCGASQAANDWFDRHVDAINQPERPIPSGRLPGQTGLAIALIAAVVALLYAAALGETVLLAAANADYDRLLRRYLGGERTSEGAAELMALARAAGAVEDAAAHLREQLDRSLTLLEDLPAGPGRETLAAITNLIAQ